MRPRMQGWPISLPTGHARCCSTPDAVTLTRLLLPGESSSPPCDRVASCCRVAWRPSHKRKPLYESDNGIFRRPHRSASGGRTGLSATENARSAIVALSWMHKKWTTPRVCATASMERESAALRRRQVLARELSTWTSGLVAAAFVRAFASRRTAVSVAGQHCDEPPIASSCAARSHWLPNCWANPLMSGARRRGCC